MTLIDLSKDHTLITWEDERQMWEFTEQGTADPSEAGLKAAVPQQAEASAAQALLPKVGRQSQSSLPLQGVETNSRTPGCKAR